MVAETKANGNRLKLSATDTADDREAARRVAAALPRAAERVDRITASLGADATVWLASECEESGYVNFDGLDVYRVWVSDRGSVALNVNLEDA